MSGSRRRVGRVAGSLLALAGVAALAPAAAADVALNEVNCAGTDWVELVNTAATPVDLSGWLLTDDPIDRSPPRDDHRLELPEATVIGPTDSLVLERQPGGFPFGISCRSDMVRLADAGHGPVDEVAIPDLPSEEVTWGRFPNGSGAWTVTKPTKGAANEPAEDSDLDRAAWLYDPSKVVEIDLSLPPASRAALVADPREYQDASFSLTSGGGTYGPLAVGLRLKGWAGSFRGLDGKAAFKVKFNHSIPGQRFFGLKGLTLNNMVQDPSMVHETLAYEVFRAAGVPAPRTGFAYVRVDGDDYGVYLDVETPDDVFLRRWFSSTGHLYEGAVGADVTAEAAPRFEVEEGPEDDLGDLGALVAAASGSGELSDRMEGLADLDEMTTMWAVERYIGHWDGYAGDSAVQPNNYFLHSDAGGRFSMLPWGTDQTFGKRVPFVDEHGSLFRQCLADDPCRSMYRSAVERLPALVAPLRLDDLTVTTADLLAPWQAADPRREQSLPEIGAGVAATRTFLASRWADVLDPSFWRPADRLAPDTEVTAGPSGRIDRPRRDALRFRFASTEPGSSFECRIDRRRWRSCEPPLSVRAGLGRRTLGVRAIDGAGNVDATPATRIWRNAGRRSRGAAGDEG